MTIRLLTGDVRDVLPTLPDASVQCVVTSPPYYGLRDYGTARWEGGADDCDHLGAPQRTRATLNANWGDGFADVKNAEARYPMRDTCGKCGARRIDAQLGLEPTPDAYIAAMVGVFRGVRRVLRDDGVMFVNMGDSYAGSTMTGGNNGINASGGEAGFKQMRQFKRNAGLSGAKPKDLLMMPARLALALQADGWWVRSDIIWAKPNPMPESCTDRPTSAHEHVFLLTKRARYFYDADAVREEADTFERQGGGEKTSPKYLAQIANGAYRGGGDLANYERQSRNLRNVWTIATAPFPGSHFATMPTELVARCIRAGTSERGCCAACGAPYVRQTERAVAFTSGSGKAGNVPNGKYAGSEQALSGEYDIRMGPSVLSVTTGWAPSCQCQANYNCSGLGCGHQPCICIGLKPCTILDPFSGAGTALLVADRLGRDAIGIDLSHAYVEMTRERLHADCPLFMDIGPSPPPAEDPEDPRMADLFAIAAD